MILIIHSFYLARDPKQLARSKPYAPLSTLIAAAMVREAGHGVRLFDATFEASPAAFEAVLAETAPAAVLLIEDNFNFITKMCTENRRRDALDMVSAASRHGCRVAVNGPDSSDNPELYLRAGADAVLTGEGEFGALDVVGAFARDRSALAATPGLILLDPDGRLRHTPPRRARPDLESVPLPAWDLVDTPSYRRAWTGAHGFLSWNMAASRGCPYSCNWCSKPTFGRRYTQRSATSVANEMRRLKEDVAPDHVWFADDIFGLSAKWIAEFADEVASRNAIIPFTMQSRVNLIDGAVAAALSRAGCVEVWLGVESGSQRILDAMDKGTRVESAASATRHLRANGIRAGWFLQLGYPPEDWHDILLTRDLVRQEAPDEIGVSVAYPLPGTPFHQRVVAELGSRRNWRDTDDLAMLFQGTFDTEFYRLVRDALHAEVDGKGRDEDRWAALAGRRMAHRVAGAPLELSA